MIYLRCSLCFLYRRPTYFSLSPITGDGLRSYKAISTPRNTLQAAESALALKLKNSTITQKESAQHFGNFLLIYHHFRLVD